MSYNITRWKTKSIENLQIHIEDLYNHDRKPSRPILGNSEHMIVKIQNVGEGTIFGTLREGILNVTSIQAYGEGSGTFMRDCLEPVLKNSKGKLEAILIWEGGDSITKLTVNDGVVEELNHEI